MSEVETNPYEAIAEDAKKNLQRVKVLVSSLTDKAKNGDQAALQEVVATLLKEQLTVYSLLTDVAGLAKDLDEGLTGVEESIDAIAEAGDEEDDEEGEETDEEEGDEEMQDDETGESQLEPHHAEPLKYLIQAFITSLSAAIAQPGLDPQQKSSVEELVRLCNEQVKFIDNITLVDDDDSEEGEEEEDDEDEED